MGDFNLGFSFDSPDQTEAVCDAQGHQDLGRFGEDTLAPL